MGQEAPDMAIETTTHFKELGQRLVLIAHVERSGDGNRSLIWAFVKEGSDT